MRRSIACTLRLFLEDHAVLLQDLNELALDLVAEVCCREFSFCLTRPVFITEFDVLVDLIELFLEIGLLFIGAFLNLAKDEIVLLDEGVELVANATTTSDLDC